MSDSVQPQRQQPTRLPRPWDSPGKNTGVGCHFLLQCMKVKSEREVAQSCPTPSNPMDCSPPGSSVHGICQARVLEWGAIDFSEHIAYTTYKNVLGFVDHKILVTTTQLCHCTIDNIYIKIQRRQWHPTPVLLPGKSHGRRSLVGCSPWGC